MDLQGRNLTRDLRGDDVAVLQRELRQLGYEIPDDEVEKKIFGDQTFKAVLEFQRAHGLKANGDILGLTAAASGIIDSPSTSRVRAFWGLPAGDLSPVRTFLGRAGLTYAELTDLLATRFINPRLPTRTVDLAPSTSTSYSSPV